MIHTHARRAPLAVCVFVFIVAMKVRLVDGFRPTINQQMRTVDTYLEMATKKKPRSDILPSVDRNPFREVDVDMKKAKDVADHFGDYTTKQIEKMRDGTNPPGPKRCFDMHAKSIGLSGRISTMLLFPSSRTLYMACL
jgi:hypothetical protein